MHYKILQAKVEYKKNAIERVTVLIDCTHYDCKPFSDVRAISASTEILGGYMSIPANAELSNDLLQKVAGRGREIIDRDKIFPTWKKNFLKPVQ